MEEWRSCFLKQIKQNSTCRKEDQIFQERIMFDMPLFSQDFDLCQVGSERQQKKIVKNRNREHRHKMIVDDYLSSSPTYSDADFRRRFRMTRRLFNRFLAEVPIHDDYFVQKRDAANKKGLSSVQKITAALHQLAYGVGADVTDEYCRLADSTGRESLYRFCAAIRSLYGDEYLQKPTTADFARVVAVNEQRGFPGMFGSLDCMHYEWKNCPVAWQGQFSGKDGRSSIILEAIADHELWFWHAFFGVPGSNNDLNVLHSSPLLNDIIHGKYDSNVFCLNGVTFQGAYLLVDGIYPKWSCFLPTIQQPQNETNKLYAKSQEALRKDVERAFGVLQARWGIIRQPARSWHLERVVDVLLACVILHNMIIEDERGERHEELQISSSISSSSRTTLLWHEYLQAVKRVECSDSHYILRNHLIEHLWKRHGSLQNSE